MFQSATGKSTPLHMAIGFLVAFAAVAAITFLLSVIQATQIMETGQYVRPYGVLYLLVVVLIASRWGGRAGFFALGLSLAAAKSFLMQQHFTLGFSTGRDQWEAGSLLLVGTLMILALSEQRASRQKTLRLLETVSIQQRELQAVLDSMNDGLIVADLQGNILNMNAAALRMHGYESVDEVRGPRQAFTELSELYYPDWRLMPPEDRPFARVLRGERFSNYEAHVRRVSSGQFWDGSFSGTQVPGEDGRPALILITVRDVTERQAMRDALQISEERLRFALGSAHIGTWHWDLRADLVLCSPQCRDLYGLPSEADLSLGQYLDALHPDDREPTRQALIQALEVQGSYRIRHRAVRPGGAIHWIILNGQGYYDAAGASLYLEGVAQEFPTQADADPGFAATLTNQVPVVLEDP